MIAEASLADEAATKRLGAALARSLPDDSRGLLLSLSGQVGAGKSTLVRALLRALGHDGPVPSPTYTLVEPYEIDGRFVYHVDLYRISDPGELEFIGWSDLREGLVLVEWPEKVRGLAAAADVTIELEYAGDGRVARLASAGARGDAWLDAARLSDVLPNGSKLCS